MDGEPRWQAGVGDKSQRDKSSPYEGHSPFFNGT
jgi:hypothetical protein